MVLLWGVTFSFLWQEKFRGKFSGNFGKNFFRADPGILSDFGRYEWGILGFWGVSRGGPKRGKLAPAPPAGKIWGPRVTKNFTTFVKKNQRRRTGLSGLGGKIFSDWNLFLSKNFGKNFCTLAENFVAHRSPTKVQSRGVRVGNSRGPGGVPGGVPGVLGGTIFRLRENFWEVVLQKISWRQLTIF